MHQRAGGAWRAGGRHCERSENNPGTTGRVDWGLGPFPCKQVSDRGHGIVFYLFITLLMPEKIGCPMHPRLLLKGM